MEQYTRPKTVRFKPDTWGLINAAAGNINVTTSEYIRDIVTDYVRKDVAVAP